MNDYALAAIGFIIVGGCLLALDAIILHMDKRNTKGKRLRELMKLNNTLK